jgi:hypothetical protein
MEHIQNVFLILYNLTDYLYEIHGFISALACFSFTSSAETGFQRVLGVQRRVFVECV